MLASYWDVVGLDEIKGLMQLEILRFLSEFWHHCSFHTSGPAGVSYTGQSSEPMEQLLSQTSSLAVVCCHMAKYSMQVSQMKSSRSFHASHSQLPTCFGNTTWFVRKVRFWSTCALRSMNYWEWNGIYVHKGTFFFSLVLSTVLFWTKYQVWASIFLRIILPEGLHFSPSLPQLSISLHMENTYDSNRTSEFYLLPCLWPCRNVLEFFVTDFLCN